MTAAAIPDEELDFFTTTVDVAISGTNCGDVASGHDELLYGLHRAEVARDDGEAWGMATSVCREARRRAC